MVFKRMLNLGNISKNTLYNLVGTALPLVVGLFTIPRLISGLGMEKFGVITIAWALLGYFSIFDLGLGRALTQIVAQQSETEDREVLSEVVSTALYLMAVLGVIGALCLALAAPWIVASLFKVKSDTIAEVTASLRLMAIAIPAVTLAGGIRGLLEGKQRFFGTNVLRILMGVLTFAGPWLILFKTDNLAWILACLAVMRILALLGYYWLASISFPDLGFLRGFKTKHFGPLIKFGGWMTVSNVISPLMANMDRFFMCLLFPVGLIAYYTTPFEMVTKLFIVPNAMASALFPVFSSMFVVDRERSMGVYRRSLAKMLYIMLPLVLVVFVASRFLLEAWLGSSFAMNSGSITQVLCVGVIFNSIARVPFAYLQGMGRADITAKIHIAEIPLYLMLFWGLGKSFGILGVAWAWTIRVAIDYFILSRILRVLHSDDATTKASVMPC